MAKVTGNLAAISRTFQEFTMSISPTLHATVMGTPVLTPPFGEVPYRLHETPVAAALLGLSPKTLEVERCRRRIRLSYVKMGRRVMYREADLLAFINACRVEG